MTAIARAASADLRAIDRRAGNRRSIDWRLAGVALWLGVIFALGGSARADAASLIILRPASILVVCGAFLVLPRSELRRHRALLVLAGAFVMLHLFHLVPLPPAMWQTLPGREIVVEIDRQLGLGSVWRTLSLSPAATRNSLWALMVPLSVLLLAARLDGKQHVRLLLGLLAAGLSSALLGVLQILGGADMQALYLYRVTNPDAPVGLFANRNHQAVFLAGLLPVFAVWYRLSSAGWPRERRAVVLALGITSAVVLILLVLVAGSRAGLLVTLAAIAAALLLTASGPNSSFRPAPLSAARRRTAWILAAMVAGFGFLAVAIGRGLAFERLVQGGVSEDLRVRILPTLFRTIGEYAPWGTGMGTFEQVFRMHEPRDLLAPTYMNHAHDDWLELALTGGVPAMAIVAGAIVWLGLSVWRMRSAKPAPSQRLLGWLGLAIIALLLLASLLDYPLRVPSLASFGVLACLWVSSASKEDKLHGSPDG